MLIKTIITNNALGVETRKGLQQGCFSEKEVQLKQNSNSLLLLPFYISNVTGSAIQVFLDIDLSPPTDVVTSQTGVSIGWVADQDIQGLDNCFNTPQEKVVGCVNLEKTPLTCCVNQMYWNLMLSNNLPSIWSVEYQSGITCNYPDNPGLWNNTCGFINLGVGDFSYTTVLVWLNVKKPLVPMILDFSVEDANLVSCPLGTAPI